MSPLAIACISGKKSTIKSCITWLPSSLSKNSLHSLLSLSLAYRLYISFILVSLKSLLELFSSAVSFIVPELFNSFSKTSTIFCSGVKTPDSFIWDTCSLVKLPEAIDSPKLIKEAKASVDPLKSNLNSPSVALIIPSFMPWPTRTASSGVSGTFLLPTSSKKFITSSSAIVSTWESLFLILVNTSFPFSDLLK